MWGYSGATGMVQGFAAGYFLWDVLVSVADPGLFGWGAVAHAGSALAVSMLGFVRALSTPFGGPRVLSNSLLACSVMVLTIGGAAAAVRQLLRPELRAVRAVDAVLEHPLVPG